jgi:hypothetical protein
MMKIQAQPVILGKYMFRCGNKEILTIVATHTSHLSDASGKETREGTRHGSSTVKQRHANLGHVRTVPGRN